MDQAAILNKADPEKKGAGKANRPGVTPAGRPVRVISITSGKGGVGKTNISANLAYILSGMKKRVLILDADMGLANIDVILGLTPQFNISHVLNGEKALAETIVKGPGGVMILPSSSGVQEMADLSKENKLSLLNALNNLHRTLDFMIIDTAAGIAGNVMYFNMAAEEIIVVATPEPTSLTDAYALIKVLHQRHGKKRFRLIVNMVKGPTEAKEVYKRLAQASDHFLNLSIDYLGHIVHDQHVTEAVRQQQALAMRYPQTPAVKCLEAIAERLCRETAAEPDRGGLNFFWENIIDRGRG